jgi:hypothetical protein
MTYSSITIFRLIMGTVISVKNLTERETQTIDGSIYTLNQSSGFLVVRYAKH